MRRRTRRVSGAGPPISHPPRLPSHRVNYSLTPSTVRPGPLPEQNQQRILLVGDAGARPDGLERFLVRGGFQVTEADFPPSGPDRPGHQPPDLVVFSIGAKDVRLADQVRDLATATRFSGAPVIVLVADAGADAVADALQAGAQDAMTTPVHFGELRARIDADLRLRRELHEARDALRTRDLLFDIFQEVSAALRADEIFQTLVRRVGQAFGLTHCSFVLTAPGEDERRAAIYRRQISAGVTDVLTGCASLDGLDRRLRDEFERARRYSLRFALVVIDVDRLRDINERLGQQAGDRVLGELGAMMQREIRAPDFVARYGGDEFALILPETDAQGGRQFVERLRQLLARHTFPDLGPGKVPALSAGVVAFPHSEVLRPEDLFTQVEAALDRGKKSAPDRIGLSEQP